LNWLDLIPVFSFIFLGRKCRYCSEKISWQYPLVELATGALFVVAYWMNAHDSVFSIQYSILILRDWIAIAALIVIFVYDLKWMIIPDSVVLPALVAVAILNFFIGVPIISMAIGLAIGFGFFGLQYVVSKGTWIGGGDLRLGALMGVLLGWPLILVALFLSYIIGAAISLVLIVQKKATAKSQVPFGVFLAPAAIVALFWGQKILSWYLGG
jgi:prepilin signal peptidase PulO-like enzyme (type II secretory pathway)